jgi:hypothetical protein
MNLQGLTRLLRDRVPFTFTKFGDGELFCMSGRRGDNCDHHLYTPELRHALTRAFQHLVQDSQVYVGQWYQKDLLRPFERQFGATPRYVWYQLLLLMKLTPELLDWYTALAEQRRRKVFVGPARLIGASQMLRCNRFVEVPLVNAFNRYREVREILQSDAAEIFLFSAGMASKPWISDLLKMRRSITCVDLGSALDPVFVGRTRTSQVPTAQARYFFRTLLPVSMPPRSPSE